MKKQARRTTEKVVTNELLVVTGDPSTRGWGSVRRLNVADLSKQMNIFLDQMSGVLKTAPELVGSFRFDEFEISAEITAKGSLALLGTGGEAGASGGIKFVFRRSG